MHDDDAMGDSVSVRYYAAESMTSSFGLHKKL